MQGPHTAQGAAAKSAATPGQQGQEAGLDALIFRFSSWRIYEEGAGFLPPQLPDGASQCLPSQAMQQAGIVTDSLKVTWQKGTFCL